MKVYLLNIEQKALIEGKEYAKGCYFNPVQDADGNWFISPEEVESCNNPEFAWAKTLQEIEFKPIEINEEEI